MDEAAMLEAHRRPRRQVDDRLLGQVRIEADDATRRLIDSIGRTEDVSVAPSGRRVAIAGFIQDVIAVARIKITQEPGGPMVHLDQIVLVHSSGLSKPHGLVLVDDDLLFVANRHAEVVLLDLGVVDGTSDRVWIENRIVISGSSEVPVCTPGSLTARWISDHHLEVIVVNNYAHELTRHVLDRSSDWAVVDGESLLTRGLDIPDGVALDRSASWLAVTNHNAHCVHLYRYDARLGSGSMPSGVLIGPHFPHGVCFSADGRHLLVADAGTPYMFAFTAEDGDWSGSRGPSKVTRVIDEDLFLRRLGCEEGGPKGIDLTDEGVVIVTGEFVPMSFYLESDLIGEADQSDRFDGVIAPWIIRLIAERFDAIHDRDEAIRRLNTLRSSTSWRITSPLRWASRVSLLSARLIRRFGRRPART